MKKFLAACLLAIVLPAVARDLVVVTGAKGEPSYGPIFQKQADAWSAAAKAAGIKVRVLPEATRDDLHSALDALPKDGDDLWLVLIGHGTFDGRTAKFNLRGDDVSSTELAAWLEPFHRRLIVLNLFSASGAFLSDLSRADRIVITATRNGTERNYTRFGEKFAEGLSGSDADLDGDGTVSLVELVANATALTRTSYENDQRIIGEHALLDDNGDGAGTESKTILHPGPDADGALAATISLARNDFVPPFTAAQSARRGDIEARIATLREQKSELSESVYYQKLESLLLEMAQLYQSARSRHR